MANAAKARKSRSTGGGKKWIAGAIKRPGALRAAAKRAGALRDNISVPWLRKQAKAAGRRGKQARLALTLRKF